MKRFFRIVAALGFTWLATGRAAACGWDSDTLAQEARGLPGVLETLVGHYPVQPDEYYEMRLARVLPLIAADPSDLALYDDAAVALDRLKRYDEAIEILADKRRALDAWPADDPVRVEHEYRYVANLGTTYAHRWVANPDRENDLSDLRQARDLIAEAIRQNPDAHFGREFVQLRLLEVMIEARDFPPMEYGEVVRRLAAVDPYADDRDDQVRRTIEGYVGLITLGQAARSVDCHAALLALLSEHQAGVLGEVAQSRLYELLNDGQRSVILPHATVGEIRAAAERTGRSQPWPEDVGLVRAYYRDARTTALAGQRERRSFMLARFDQGQHPDTHPTFWDGYTEPATIPPPDGVWLVGGNGPFAHYALAFWSFTTGVVLTLGVVLLWLLGRALLRRRRRARSTIVPV